MSVRKVREEAERREVMAFTKPPENCGKQHVLEIAEVVAEGKGHTKTSDACIQNASGRT